MHPKIAERRKAVLMARLEYVSPEEQEKDLAKWVSHFEKELPRPWNYKKKTLPHLRKLLRKIDGYLESVSKPGWGSLGEMAFEMYQRHRGYVLAELARRMMVNTPRTARGGGA